MFAVYMAIASIILYVLHAVRDITYDKNARSNAIKKGRSWYTDAKTGMLINVQDGTQFRYKRINGDLCKVNKSGSVIENLSEEKRNGLIHEGIANFKANGNPFYVIDESLMATHYADGCYGEHYKCVHDNNTYVKRHFPGATVYIDVMTGRVKHIDNKGTINKQTLAHLNKLIETYHNALGGNASWAKRFWRYDHD